MSYYEAFPNSQKIYVQDEQFDGIKIPFREVVLSDTELPDGRIEHNAAVRLYDTSGVYTDPHVAIDIHKGLTPSCDAFVWDRGDVERLTVPTSVYRSFRDQEPQLDGIRFPVPQLPLRAKQGRKSSIINLISLRECAVDKVSMSQCYKNGKLFKRRRIRHENN